MIPFFIFWLLVAAGAAIVAQNLLMAGMTEVVPTVLMTLVINPAVGLAAAAALR
jgi:bacterial/archaeal transporter family-2 protein